MAKREQPRTSVETRRVLRVENGERIMLAFSRGKDAIAAWIALRDEGFDVIPVHYSAVPRLEFVAESLAYYELVFSTPIVDIPHPSFYASISSGVFQPPSSFRALESLSLHREIEYRDIYDDVAAAHGCGPWYATGVRASDSNVRRLSLSVTGSLVGSQRKAHVIWDWRAEDVRNALRRTGVKLPVDYVMFGRSFDGLGIEYLHAIKARFPRDYQRIIGYFPLLEAEVFRDERMRA